MTNLGVGEYECVATNEHGEARHKVYMDIADYPYFLRRPETQIVMSQKNGKFQAVVRGVPVPEIRWYKDWLPLGDSSRIKIINAPSDDGDRYIVTSILTIEDVIHRDDGT